MALIEIMSQRKIDNKTYRTLGASNWHKVAAKLQEAAGVQFSSKAVTKKWSNLKTRYKMWKNKFHGINSSGTAGYKT